LRVEIVYLVGGELFVGARVGFDINGVEIGVGYMVIRSDYGSGGLIVDNVFVELGRLNIVDLSASALGTGSIKSSHGASSSPGSVVVGVGGRSQTEATGHKSALSEEAGWRCRSGSRSRTVGPEVEAESLHAEL
jgi:hypothetical protein